MTFGEQWVVLRRGWVKIFLGIWIGALAATGFTASQSPIFGATCRLFVAMGGIDATSQNVLQGAQFAAQRVRSYTEVVDSPNVLNPVIRQLKLDMNATELAEKISATNPLDTVLIDVKASDLDAVQAANLANLACSNLGTEIERIELIKTGLSQSSAVTVSVINPATVAAFPVSPRPRINLALGILLGATVAAGIVILRDRLDTTIKELDDIQEIVKAAPIGTVPFDNERKLAPLAALSLRSRASESFRSLRTNLRYVDVDNPPKVFVVTSSVPGEGKSTTAANLAITFAVDDAKVVVVEGDLRLPRLASYLGIDSSAGISDVLAGAYDLDDVIVPFREGLLDVIPAGTVPPNPAELLGSELMRELLTTLRNRYDVVVIDSPPLLPVTDAAILANLGDGALVVVRHGRTTKEQLGGTIDALSQVSAHIIGTIVNFAPAPGARGYRYGGYGNYGGYGSYSGYGNYGSYGGDGAGYGGYGYGGYGGNAGYGYGYGYGYGRGKASRSVSPLTIARRWLRQGWREGGSKRELEVIPPRASSSESSSGASSNAESQASERADS